MLKAYALLAVLCLSLSAVADVTLTYRGTNHWVSANDNKPLQELVALAKKGRQNYTAEFPVAQPDLAAERLLVLQTILEKYAKTPVLITATESATLPNNSILFKE